MPLSVMGDDGTVTAVGLRDPISHQLSFDSDEDEQVTIDSGILSGNSFLAVGDSDNSDCDARELMKLPKIASSPRPSCSKVLDELNNNYNVCYTENEDTASSSSSSSGNTPPYKRVGALKLSGILKETDSLWKADSSLPQLIPQTFMSGALSSRFNPSSFPRTPSTPAPPSRSKSLLFSTNRLAKCPRLTSTAKRSDNCDKKTANVNPFFPCNMQSPLKSKKKRSRKSFEFDGIKKLDGSLLDVSDESLLEDTFTIRPSKRVAVNISRYNVEFIQVCQIGSGQFGNVYKCRNRLDGCLYAVKKSVREVSRISNNQMNLMNEVYAHAFLGKQKNIIGYYSSWTEDGHMYIQNEYCNGGTLAELIAERKESGFIESELKEILLQAAKGLQYVHSKNLVHLDVKPENILIHKTKRSSRISNHSDMECSNESVDHGFAEIDTSCEEDEITYKLGDFGHITSVVDPKVEEGDSRYMPVEILDENYAYLTKADIFSLGMSIYEAACGKPILNNSGIQRSRDGLKLDGISGYSEEFQELLQVMTHSDPTMRPSASAITQHKVLVPYADMTKTQLQLELSKEKFEREILAEKLKGASESYEAELSKPQASIQEIKENKSNFITKRKLRRTLSALL